MGWAYCGTDSKGREIGYAIAATCDAPGCTAEIDRGVSYACGGMHGEDEHSCERYFCSSHRFTAELKSREGVIALCSECLTEAEKSGEVKEEPEE